jgi:hypothetical protein
MGNVRNIFRTHKERKSGAIKIPLVNLEYFIYALLCIEIFSHHHMASLVQGDETKLAKALIPHN